MKILLYYITDLPKKPTLIPPDAKVRSPLPQLLTRDLILSRAAPLPSNFLPSDGTLSYRLL